jgi:hypothetical protein
MTMQKTRTQFVMLATLLASSTACAPPAPVEVSEASVVYLVRHAERAEDGTNDPPISEAGQARSDLLAEMLRDAGITHVHTTDFDRTRSTGMPLAESQGLDLEFYNPGDLRSSLLPSEATPSPISRRWSTIACMS